MSCKCYSKSLHYHPTTKLSKSIFNFRWYSSTIRYWTLSDCWTIICTCSEKSVFTTNFVFNLLSFIIRTQSLIQPFYQGTVYNPTIEQIRILLKRLSSVSISSLFLLFRYYDCVYQQYNQVSFPSFYLLVTYQWDYSYSMWRSRYIIMYYSCSFIITIHERSTRVVCLFLYTLLDFGLLVVY